MLLDTTSAIRTPERVRFRHQVAGPGRRSVAWAFDAVLQAMLLAVVGVVMLLVGGTGWGSGALLVAAFLVSWFYGAVLEIAMAGQTPGKLITGLRVVTATGAPAAPLQLVLRNLLRGVDFLPFGYGIGVFAMAADPALRRVGDLVAGTLVVDERRGDLLGAVPLDPPITEEERRALPPRVSLERPDVDALETLLRRRSELSPGRVDELAAMVGPLLNELGVEGDDDLRSVTLAYARATGRDRALDDGGTAGESLE